MDPMRIDVLLFSWSAFISMNVTEKNENRIFQFISIAYQPALLNKTFSHVIHGYHHTKLWLCIFKGSAWDLLFTVTMAITAPCLVGQNVGNHRNKSA